MASKKKQTGLSLSATKADNFPEWYHQVITHSEMIDYYDVSGCFTLRPHSFAIWELITAFFDGEIKARGVQNCYFPMFVSERSLNAEADHVEGFAPEVAWVTRSGDSELAQPIAIRPTSETIMYPAYARWIRSHRDLPVRLNQWTNVCRWEFKNATPFLRTREFLWQEGHTAHATQPEADEQVLEILDLYARVYEELLAVPVIQGRKSEKEKFAGGLYTTTVEAFIPGTGRAIQGATSHNLGQNFARMFGIQFETEVAGEPKQYVWQTSWGLTTRTIGVAVMVHSDDKGLVLPPRVAPQQAVVVWFYDSKCSEEQKEALQSKAAELGAALTAAGVRCVVDNRVDRRPGWRYADHEMKGVPVRIELGPRDMGGEQCVLARRDTGDKTSCAWADLASVVPALLDGIQADMLARARAERDSRIIMIDSWDEFSPALDNRCLVLAPWCERTPCEEDIKARTKAAAAEAAGQAAPQTEEEALEQAKQLSGAAKTLCIPFNQSEPAEGTVCFACGQPALSNCLFGRSY